MIIEAQLHFKDTEVKTDRCQVDEVIELPHGNFEYFRNLPLSVVIKIFPLTALLAKSLSLYTTMPFL